MGQDAKRQPRSPLSEDDTTLQQAARQLAYEVQTMSLGAKGVRDVTEEFVAAARQLPPGHLVKDESFTLFEAVGALEVGSNMSTMLSLQTCR